MQDKQTSNLKEISDLLSAPNRGRVLALDIGTRRIGAAICDEMQITARPLETIIRRNWKELLKKISEMIENFDAVILVLGLPYNYDGSESEMSQDARRLARNFSLSLKIPVFLHDERLTSVDARQNLHDRGLKLEEIRRKVDGEAAVIILQDFLIFKTEVQNGKIKF